MIRTTNRYEPRESERCSELESQLADVRCVNRYETILDQGWRSPQWNHFSASFASARSPLLSLQPNTCALDIFGHAGSKCLLQRLKPRRQWKTVISIGSSRSAPIRSHRLPRHVLQQSVMRKSMHERLFLDDSDMVMRIIWSIGLFDVKSVSTIHGCLKFHKVSTFHLLPLALWIPLDRARPPRLLHCNSAWHMQRMRQISGCDRIFDMTELANILCPAGFVIIITIIAYSLHIPCWCMLML